LELETSRRITWRSGRLSRDLSCTSYFAYTSWNTLWLPDSADSGMGCT